MRSSPRSTVDADFGEVCSELFNMGVFQVRAAKAGSRPAGTRAGTPPGPLLDVDGLSILTSWAEAVADALALAPHRLEGLDTEALAGAPWRGPLGIPEPSPQLNRAISCMFRAVCTATAAHSEAPLDAVLHAVRDRQPGEPGLDRLVRRVVRSTLEQRQARRANEGGGRADFAPA